MCRTEGSIDEIVSRKARSLPVKDAWIESVENKFVGNLKGASRLVDVRKAAFHHQVRTRHRPCCQLELRRVFRRAEKPNILRDFCLAVVFEETKSQSAIHLQLPRFGDPVLVNDV